MKAYRSEKRIEAGGALHLHALPFAEGETVEIIVRPRAEEKETPTPEHSLLRGAVRKYVDPTAPVAAQAWEAAR